jgi:hypothetical protein
MKPTKRNPPDLVNQTTAAKIIGCNRQNIPGMIARGQLESVPVAGMVFVVKSSAQRLADVLADKRAA